MRSAILAVALALWASASAHAQDARLAARLAPRALVAVTAIVDSARAEQLPTEPLVNKALEGASKGADASRIIDAVRYLARRLSVARATLGTGASESELVSAAAALYAGVKPETLNRVVQPSGGGSVARRLVVLVDLIQLGVPQDTAVALITDLVAAGVSDDEYIMLRELVGDDVRRGAAPGPASVTRVRGLLLTRGRDGGADSPLPRIR